MGKRSANAKEQLVEAATSLFRARGYDAASVDEICAAAGVSKGAFFHHFENKEAIGAACLDEWSRMADRLDAAVQAMGIEDPGARLLALLDYAIERLTQGPPEQASCLAGTIVQEAHRSSPTLREAGRACFGRIHELFRRYIDAAAKARGVDADAGALANCWLSAVQGGLILVKAEQRPQPLLDALRHTREYIRERVKA
jgi:TetR/AcrR family transcriptional repressor of nem operon